MLVYGCRPSIEQRTCSNYNGPGSNYNSPGSNFFDKTGRPASFDF
jgi:hypothetical protein